jgi:uncharacterized protein (TIGR02001 family)
MKKYFAITAIAAATVLLAGNAFAQSGPDAEKKVSETPAASPFTANVTLVNDYRYRGISQSAGKPAIQGGFDYAHESGFYIGNWNSSISWVQDGYAISAPVEMDFYAGFKKEVISGLTADIGVLQYYYPMTQPIPSALVSPNTTEAYIGAAYEFLTFKYSYSLTNLFGFTNSSGSSYLDLGANYDTGWYGVTLNGHVGYQAVNKNSNYTYVDWKLGATKDLGNGFAVSAAYVGTNAKSGAYFNSATGSSTSNGTGIIALTKTF